VEVNMSSIGEGSERSAKPSAAGRAAPDESPVLIHVWDVLDPGQHEATVGRLEQMLSQITDQPGFISGRLLESADGRSIAFVLEMRTVEDRQRLQDFPIVSETLVHVNGVMNLVIKLYHETAAYHA
jgi:hypothetical protein